MLGNGKYRRQIWALPSSTTSSTHRHCTPFTLPSKGVLTINHSSIITLSVNAVFAPECTGGAAGSYHAKPGDPSSVADLRDPFYASTSPQIYAIAAATVVSYLLVIMLFITPRTFFVGGPGGGSGFLGRRGIISGSYGSTSIVGVGRRPWLQKVAALTVAISLTIATADTFKVAKRQYEVGYMDANALTDEVVGGLEIRIVRVISTTFLWLAQVQTLIRLFPRHKEKVIIKWTGFALIVLDTIFSILNSFVDTSGRTRPRSFVDAVPALSYLFELSLSLLYAAWVIYYSLCKRRFAFFHTKMRNICLVALLSLSAVLVPVVFFVLDISKPDVAGWGDYIRWVGAAAASVVVWEWVERIEALERDERKDGILGREIFDGDEMLEVTPSAEIDWPRHPRYRPEGPGGGLGISSGWDGVNGIIHRPLRTRFGFQPRPNRTSQNMPSDPRAMASGALPGASQTTHPTPPPAAMTPVSRADTTSAASTIYAVRYHPITGPSPTVPEEIQVEEPKEISESSSTPSTSPQEAGSKEHDSTKNANPEPTSQSKPRAEILRWITVNNPFKRRRASPPPEVAIAQAIDHSPPRTSPITAPDLNGRWNMKSKIESFAVSQRERLKSRSEGRTTETSLPVTVIPAQRRGNRTWSPQEFEDQTSQRGTNEQTGGSSDRTEHEQQPSSELLQTATTDPHYVPLPQQFGLGDPWSVDSSFQSNPNNRLYSRRGNLTFAEDERHLMTSPTTTSSQNYRYSSYILPASTELAPIASVPSSELSLQQAADPAPISSPPAVRPAPPAVEASEMNSVPDSNPGRHPEPSRGNDVSEDDVANPVSSSPRPASNHRRNTTAPQHYSPTTPGASQNSTQNQDERALSPDLENPVQDATTAESTYTPHAP